MGPFMSTPKSSKMPFVANGCIYSGSEDIKTKGTKGIVIQTSPGH